MSTRINARLDDDLAQALTTLARREGQPLTALLEEAVRALVEKRQRPDSARALRQSGLVGAARGPRDLSSRVKEHLTATLERKA